MSKSKTVTILLTDFCWTTIAGVRAMVRLEGIEQGGRQGLVTARAENATAEALIQAVKSACAARGHDFAALVERNPQGGRQEGCRIGEALLEIRLEGSWLFEGHDRPRSGGRSGGRPGRKLWRFAIRRFEILPPVEAPADEAAFRAFVRDAVALAVQRSDCHKSSEGWLTVGWEWPDIFATDQRPSARIELYCYVMGPGRHHEWSGRTMADAMAAARADIARWLVEDLDSEEDADDDVGDDENRPAPSAADDPEVVALFARHGVPLPIP